MLQNLVLHIGTEKTGTSSIQAFLRINRELLNRKGFFVPGFLGTPEGNHRWLPFMFYQPEQVDDWIILQNLHDPDTRTRKLQELAAKIDECSKQTREKTWIVSSEHLQSRLTSHKQVAQLREFLKAYFREVKVIIYLRDPISTSISFWSTAVRTGSSIFSLPGPGQIANYNCAHKEILERWLSVFGKENMVVRLFSRQNLLENDLIADFARHANVPCDSGFVVPGVENKTLSYKAIKILSHVNESIPFAVNGRLNQLRGNLHSFFDGPFESYPRYLPTLSQLKDYGDFYSEGSEWTRSQFFQYLPSLWDYQRFAFRDDDDPRFCSTITDDEKAFSRCLIDIWLAKQKHVMQLKRLK